MLRSAPPLRRRTLVSAGVLAGAGLAVGASAAGAERAKGGGLPQAPRGGGPVDLDCLDVVFDVAFAATGTAGMAAQVQVGSTLWQRAAGVADRATRQPFSVDGHVRIGSITKTFTGTAVLQLVDSGALALSDPLERFVPGIRNGDRITVEHLLGMRSGIYDFTADDGFQRQFDDDPLVDWSIGRTVEVIEQNDPLFEPGERVSYSDSNFVLLGGILQTVTGRYVDEWIHHHVIDELALLDTSFPRDAAIPRPHPTGYVPRIGGDGASGRHADLTAPPRVVDEVNPEVAGAAGAMISTVVDLHDWARELTDGTLLTRETQAARLRSRRFDGQQVNLGYGLGVMTLNDFVGHDGAIFGFSSIVMRRPQTDCTIVLVGNESTNSTTPTFDVALRIIEALYPDQLR